MRAALPDELWTDPICKYLRKRKRRQWILLCDMERFRGRWHPDDVARFTVGVWAVNLEMGERQLEKDIAAFREMGIMSPDAIVLTLCRPAAENVAASLDEAYKEAVRERQRRHRAKSGVTEVKDVTPIVTPESPETSPIVTPMTQSSLARAGQSDRSDQIDSSDQSDSIRLNRSESIRPAQEAAPPVTPPSKNEKLLLRAAERVRHNAEKWTEAEIKEAIRRCLHQSEKTVIKNEVGYLLQVLKSVRADSHADDQEHMEMMQVASVPLRSAKETLGFEGEPRWGGAGEMASALREKIDFKRGGEFLSQEEEQERLRMLREQARLQKEA